MHETAIDLTPGFSLGGTVPRFTLRSATATGVVLVVTSAGSADGADGTDRSDGSEGRPTRHPLERVPDTDVWTGEVPGVVPGDRYHLLVDGPVGPRHEFDPTRPLLDPYARGILPTGND